MRRDVAEKVYPPEIDMELETFMNCANILPENVLTTIAESLQVNIICCILLKKKTIYYECEIGSTSEHIHTDQIDG